MLFGAHVSSAGGISTAIDRADELGCDAVQIFPQSPRMWKPTAHTPEQVERFRSRRDEAGIRSVVCHALYLVNLASPDPEIHARSVTAMRASLETASAIGAEGVVFHVGSHLGEGLDAGLARVVPALAELLELTDDRLWLVLENSAGAGGLHPDGRGRQQREHLLHLAGNAKTANRAVGCDCGRGPDCGRIGLLPEK